MNFLFGCRLIDAYTEATIVNVGVKTATVVFDAIRAIIVLMAASNDLEDLAHKCAVWAIGVVYPRTINLISGMQIKNSEERKEALPELKLGRQLDLLAVFGDIDTVAKEKKKKGQHIEATQKVYAMR